MRSAVLLLALLCAGCPLRGDDDDATVHPGADEVCGDGVQNDCDADPDEAIDLCLPTGELALAAYCLSQIRFPYHAIRLAVTMAHTALVAPKGVVPSMDAFVDGWSYGRHSRNINFEKWEQRLGEPLAALQAEMNLRQIAKAA